MNELDHSSSSSVKRVDVIVLGAGISGLVTAKIMKESGFDVIILERTDEVGGLWTFRENDYGVMRFTRMLFSKHICFSDFPYPEHVPDYPHHTDTAGYIKDYTNHFNIKELIRFQTEVISVEQKDSGWQIIAKKFDESAKEVYIARFVAVATGLHAIPRHAKFNGEETFKGEIIHSVTFKNVVTNGLVGKRVLVVGLGNSAVDVACNAATKGRCKSVYISTRSGAWVIPNYVFGYPSNQYACRFFLWLPWNISAAILETAIKLVSGDPTRWNLNPKKRALETQVTISPTLINHIQEQRIQIVPDVVRIGSGNSVHFADGQKADFDYIVSCTGYKTHLPYLSKRLENKVVDPETNRIKLFKNVFSPELGHSLAFIGFVQPSSGGVLMMSETQAMWFAELCRERIQLPSSKEMLYEIQLDQGKSDERWYNSARHTIQRDPIIYNDEIASYFGAKPEIWKHPTLAWRLLFGSCGAAQWRLEGPFRWSGAAEMVRSTPITPMMNCAGMVMVFLLLASLFIIFKLFRGLFY